MKSFILIQSGMSGEQAPRLTSQRSSVSSACPGMPWAVNSFQHFRSTCLSNSLQRFPVPVAQVCAGIVSTLQEISQRLYGRAALPHVVIHQQKLLKAGVIEALSRPHNRLGKSFRLRGCVSIKRGIGNVAAPRPEPRANDFVRISLPSDSVGPGSLRRSPPREPCHGYIETSPEEVYRAAFADKSRSKHLKDLIHRHQDAPKSVRVCRIIGSMLLVPIKRNRIGDFNRHVPDFYIKAEPSERTHKLLIEVGNRAWVQPYTLHLSRIGLDGKTVVNKIKLNLKNVVSVWNRRCVQAPGADIQGHLPPVVDMWTQCQSYFANDLRPHVESMVGIRPLLQRKRGPGSNVDELFCFHGKWPFSKKIGCCNLNSGTEASHDPSNLKLKRHNLGMSQKFR